MVYKPMFSQCALECIYREGGYDRCYVDLVFRLVHDFILILYKDK